MELENVILEKSDQLAIITINHPPANAWNLATAKDFEVAIDDVNNDKGVRAVIITGSGDKCFSAGFDVPERFRGAYGGGCVRSGDRWRAAGAR